MKNQIFVVFIALLSILLSCENTDNIKVIIEDGIPDTHDSILKDSHVQKGVLKGITGIYTGDCQPKIECFPYPLSTTVAITLPSENFDMDLLVDSVVSSMEGLFEITLPEGRYSLFLRDGDSFVCSGWSYENDCYPVTIKQDSVANVVVNIDHAYW